jgi:hypothetical protein
MHSAGCPWNEGTFEAAAGHGNLVTLQWLHSSGCPWNEGTCSAAVRSGNLEMLKWLHYAGCPWNEDTCKTAAAAALRGNHGIYEWVIDHGCPNPFI